MFWGVWQEVYSLFRLQAQCKQTKPQIRAVVFLRLARHRYFGRRKESALGPVDSLVLLQQQPISKIQKLNSTMISFKGVWYLSVKKELNSWGGLSQPPKFTSSSSSVCWLYPVLYVRGRMLSSSTAVVGECLFFIWDCAPSVVEYQCSTKSSWDAENQIGRMSYIWLGHLFMYLFIYLPPSKLNI